MLHSVAGRTFIARTPSIPAGPYLVIHKLPLTDTDPQRHAKGKSVSVRVLCESQIKEFTLRAANEDTEPVSAQTGPVAAAGTWKAP
jgi:hypothetical protein